MGARALQANVLGSTCRAVHPPSHAPQRTIVARLCFTSSYNLQSDHADDYLLQLDRNLAIVFLLSAFPLVEMLTLVVIVLLAGGNLALEYGRRADERLTLKKYLADQNVHVQQFPKLISDYVRLAIMQQGALWNVFMRNTTTADLDALEENSELEKRSLDTINSGRFTKRSLDTINSGRFTKRSLDTING